MYSVLAMTIDIVFFFDFVLKACLLRGPHFKSAWSFVDFISALPVLSYLPLSESNLHVMRLRGLRFFMILRTLRGLRFLRLMRGLQADIFTDGLRPVATLQPCAPRLKSMTCSSQWRWRYLSGSRHLSRSDGTGAGEGVHLVSVLLR